MLIYSYFPIKKYVVTSFKIEMIIIIAPDKVLFCFCCFFNPKVLILYLFLHTNICCGYTFETPIEALLMSTHNICFRRKIRKYLPNIPSYYMCLEIRIFLNTSYLRVCLVLL